jgi:predicted negative regulator of RcsB-dependent stress response
MAAKLSKKELEGPDAFQSTVEKFSDYITENRRRFFTIVAAIICVILIAIGIYFYWSNYQTSATQLYAKAQDILVKNGDKPETLKESIPLYKELIDKYPHSWSARMARYHLGNIYYNSGEIDSAIESYKGYLSSATSDNAGIKYLVLTALGYSYEAKKDYKSALDYFEQAQKSNNVGFEAIGYRNIARIYEQMNDRKKALENYQNALLKTTDPAMAAFIKYKIASLS